VIPNPANSVPFEFPEDDPFPAEAEPSREQALEAMVGIVQLLLESRTPNAAWRRLYVLAWELHLLPEIRSQCDLAKKLGVSPGQITNLKAEWAAMFGRKRNAGRRLPRN
jgi:hypothetical protein